MEKLSGKRWEGFVFSGLVNSVGVRCHWAAPALESSWCTWDCTAPGVKLGPHGSGFTSNFLAYLYPQANSLFVHFLEGNLVLHQFHIQFFGWFETLHMCWERDILIFGGLWGFFKPCPQLCLAGLFTLNLRSGKGAGCTQAGALLWVRVSRNSLSCSSTGHWGVGVLGVHHMHTQL